MNTSITEIINNINPSWQTDLKIRYIYYKVNSLVQKDLRYFCASDEEKYKQYQNGFVNRFPYIVCSTLADCFVDIFKSVDIYAKKVVANSAKIPLFALIVLGDHGFYFLDPINDIFNIQYNLYPQNFGVIPYYRTLRKNYHNLTHLDRKYLEELDTTLNNNIPVNYTNNYIKELKDKMCQRNKACEFLGIPKGDRVSLTSQKLVFFNDHLINIGNVKGPFERTRLYYYLFNNLLSSNEERQIDIYLDDIEYEIANVYLKLHVNPSKYLLFREEKKDDNYQLKLIK